MVSPGIHNVFRYVFNVPAGDFALLGIAFNVASIQFQWSITNWKLATLALATFPHWQHSSSSHKRGVP
jgi:hypothetical protein